MLEELLAITDHSNFEDYQYLLVNHIEGSEYAITLHLDIIGGENPDIPSHWQVACSGVREHSLSMGYSSGLRLFADHVLLLPHTARKTSTYFHGKCDNPSAVVGALYERHWELANQWIPFHMFLNPRMHLMKLVSGNAGMLADGPEPFILAYEEVMGRYGFSTSHLEPAAPVHWDGEKWVEEKAKLSVLILDEDYIVAESFEAKAI